MNTEKLFFELYNFGEEESLHSFVINHPLLSNQDNWYYLGGNSSNFSIVKNQQANPIAALIEKVTNSIDAILTKKCLEAGIEPKSESAPRSIPEAVEKFFPNNNWDLDSFRREQAKDIQIIADGPTKSTSVIIYDNGEGQDPTSFEKTFLSLISGNKQSIHFVQGKYNMGGSGALVFCGKRRYQLIGSKRFDGTGDFGFTLVREHPLNSDEQLTNKETWYEYFKIDGNIPSFPIQTLDLKLFDRNFTTGTILKLYSYQFPSGYSGFAQDLNQSINEFLFNPALPIYTVDKAVRYPNNNVLELDLFGLQRRLEKNENDYVEETSSWDFQNEIFGKSKVRAYVFKARLKDHDSKKSQDIIRRRFFKNDMSVIFSMNGQVHGHFTSEFITRTLKLNLLKNHLLIHVDCTEMDYRFRKELFMASRDRLKDGEETRALRKFLGTELSKKGSPLYEIEKRRKDSIGMDSSDTQELLKSFTKNLPLDSELMKLLNQTFKLDQGKNKSDKKEENPKSVQNKENKVESFNPKRFPTHCNVRIPEKDGRKIVNIPRGSEKTITIDTDVENSYFDRTDEPGVFKLALISRSNNLSKEGDKAGKGDTIIELMNINKSSPKDGLIKLNLSPKQDVHVGEELEIEISLSGAGNEFKDTFWAKITQPEQKKEAIPSSEPDQPFGLPEFKLVYKEQKTNEQTITWQTLDESGLSMDYNKVMIPLAKGESELESIYINMDSHVFKSFLSKTKHPSEKQIKLAENKYISSVYFHTLFLYTITKNRGYQMSKFTKDKNDPDPIDVGEYLSDIFDNFYSSFILNFGGMDDMMTGIGD